MLYEVITHTLYEVIRRTLYKKPKPMVFSFKYKHLNAESGWTCNKKADTKADSVLKTTKVKLKE